MKSKLKKILCVVFSVCLIVAFSTSSWAVTMINTACGFVGDVNKDSWIDAKDALLVLQHSVGLVDLGNDRSIADVNGNSTVNAEDALNILRYSIGITLSKKEWPTQGEGEVNIQMALHMATQMFAKDRYDVSDFRLTHTGPYSKRFQMTYQYYIGDVPTTERVYLYYEYDQNGNLELTKYSGYDEEKFSGPDAPKVTPADYDRLFPSLERAIEEFVKDKGEYDVDDPIWVYQKSKGVRLRVRVSYMGTAPNGMASPILSEELYSDPL